MLGSLIVYLKGMRILMFQLSGIYHKRSSIGINVSWGPLYCNYKKEPPKFV